MVEGTHPHPPFSRHTPLAHFSSTGAHSGLTRTGPIVTVVPAWVLSGPASENSTLQWRQGGTHTFRSQRKLVICRDLLFSTKVFVLAQVGLIPGLRGLGNAQGWTLHKTDLPDYPSTLSLIRSANY